MTDEIERPNKFAQGIFLELQTNEGALGTPMFVSIREDNKAVLTKQVNQASVFLDPDSALAFLRDLTSEELHTPAGSFLTISSRTYNTELHHAFWTRYWEGRRAAEKKDYSFYLIQTQQLLEQINLALINGPDNVARSLLREVNATLFDLNVETTRYLDQKLAEADKRN